MKWGRSKIFAENICFAVVLVGSFKGLIYHKIVFLSKLFNQKCWQYNIGLIFSKIEVFFPFPRAFMENLPGLGFRKGRVLQLVQ